MFKLRSVSFSFPPLLLTESAAAPVHMMDPTKPFQQEKWRTSTRCRQDNMHFYISSRESVRYFGPKEKKKIKMKTTNRHRRKPWVLKSIFCWSPRCLQTSSFVFCSSSSALPVVLVLFDSPCVQQELERACHGFHLYSRPSAAMHEHKGIAGSARAPPAPQWPVVPKDTLSPLLLMLKRVDVQMHSF